MSRVSARKELRKPTTGWGGGRRGGRVCRWDWRRCTTTGISRGCAQNERWEEGGASECRGSRGKEKAPAQERLRGDWEEEQGNGREKEAFKDCVRFVVTEGDRDQPETGRLAGRDWGDGGLARGSGKGRDGQPRQNRVDSRVRTVCGRNCSSLFSFREDSVCQPADAMSFAPEAMEYLSLNRLTVWTSCVNQAGSVLSPFVNSFLQRV